MMDLVKRWRDYADELEAEATRLDRARDAFTSKYYSSMTDDEKRRWNDYTDQAHFHRVERNVYRRCAAELEEKIHEDLH